MTTSRLVFFFQAEDGIRYHCVTGVQTCALPIYPEVELLGDFPGDVRVGCARLIDALHFLIAAEDVPAAETVARHVLPLVDADRKSTRLNSSHTVISYAVFCLKKKNGSHEVGVPG